MTKVNLFVVPMTRVTCPCCDGERYLFVVNAEFPDEPPTRQPCCHCGTTGYLKLTVTEAATYATGQEQNTAPST